MASSDVYHVAVVSQSGQVSAADVMTVAAAVDKQVTRDFGPIWEIDATVNGFQTLDDVPPGYWKIVILDNIQANAEGYHQVNGQPCALVQASANIDEWSQTVSHECLEMLVDPWGNFTIEGNSPDGRQGRVQFLAEVCDPCESPAYGYTSNGVFVSDFYTPNYFDPVTATGVRYSFRDQIKQPLQVLPGGYLSWQAADGTWWQQVWPPQNSTPSIVSIPVQSPGNAGSFREQVDRISAQMRTSVLKYGRERLARPAMSLDRFKESARISAAIFNAEIRKHQR